MSHTPHELHDEFPGDTELLHKLKVDNRHYQTLAERYHDINRNIHRIESGVEPASDERLENLKKDRLKLLDDVSALINQAKATA